MDVSLAVAGFLCLALAAGHTTVGVRWVLPGIDQEHLPKTPFGPRSLTMAMVRVTWFVVTLFVTGLSGLLLTLAWSDGDPKTLLLRWFAATWVAATAVSFGLAGGRGRHVWRFPIPLLWLVVAGLLWTAST
jgi:hypothetical protein